MKILLDVRIVPVPPHPGIHILDLAAFIDLGLAVRTEDAVYLLPLCHDGYDY